MENHTEDSVPAEIWTRHLQNTRQQKCYCLSQLACWFGGNNLPFRYRRIYTIQCQRANDRLLTCQRGST
jgi:hypothetical protein